ENGPAVSPDGRYVAYAMDATGQVQVYVQPFPPTGAKWLAAEEGGAPVWSRDGREVYYRAGRVLMMLPVSTGGGLTAGSARTLLDSPTALLTQDPSTNYDVAADGRFLIVRTTSTVPLGDHVVVVTGWVDAMKKTLAEKAP